LYHSLSPPLLLQPCPRIRLLERTSLTYRRAIHYILARYRPRSQGRLRRLFSARFTTGPRWLPYKTEPFTSGALIRPYGNRSAKSIQPDGHPRQLTLPAFPPLPLCHSYFTTLRQITHYLFFTRGVAVVRLLPFSLFALYIVCGTVAIVVCWTLTPDLRHAFVVSETAYSRPSNEQREASCYLLCIIGLPPTLSPSPLSITTIAYPTDNRLAGYATLQVPPTQDKETGWSTCPPTNFAPLHLRHGIFRGRPFLMG